MWVSEKTRKKETIFLAKFSIDNMSGPGKWRLWQKLAPQERCVLRRDEGSFENMWGTSGLNRIKVTANIWVDK